MAKKKKTKKKRKRLKLKKLRAMVDTDKPAAEGDSKTSLDFIAALDECTTEAEGSSYIEKVPEAIRG